MKRPLKHSAGAIAPLLLFAIFTACILSVLLTGADVLQTISQRDQESFRHRTCAQYLTTRVRQSDVEARIWVGEFDQIPPLTADNSSSSTTDNSRQNSPSLTGDTLFLIEELGGRTYCTRIYCYGGQLRELFSLADLEFAPGDGQPILEAQDLRFDQQGELLTITITYTDGSSETLYLSLRSGEEVTP